MRSLQIPHQPSTTSMLSPAPCAVGHEVVGLVSGFAMRQAPKKPLEQPYSFCALCT